MPRHNSHVIHPLWSQHNAEVSTNAMDSRCKIFYSEGVFDRDTGLTTSVETIIYSGDCRVFPTVIGRNVNSAGQYVPIKQFTVAIPYWINDVRVDHQISFLEAEDQTLLTHLFVVKEITRSSYVWERHIVCTEDQEYENSV